MADLVHSLTSSNLPSHHKASIIERMAGHMRLGGVPAGLRKYGNHALAGVNTAREYAEGGLVGMGLGAVHALHGLDVDVKGKKVPLDLVAATLGGLVAIAMPGEMGAADARTMGGQALAIFAFRHFGAFVATKAKAAGKTTHWAFEGEDNEWATPNMGAENPYAARTSRLVQAANAL